MDTPTRFEQIGGGDLESAEPPTLDGRYGQADPETDPRIPDVDMRRARIRERVDDDADRRAEEGSEAGQDSDQKRFIDRSKPIKKGFDRLDAAMIETHETST